MESNYSTNFTRNERLRAVWNNAQNTTAHAYNLSLFGPKTCPVLVFFAAVCWLHVSATADILFALQFVRKTKSKVLCTSRLSSS